MNIIKKEAPPGFGYTGAFSNSLSQQKAFAQRTSAYVIKAEIPVRKINYSLLNLIRTLKDKKEAKRYKWLFLVLSACFIAWVIILAI